MTHSALANPFSDSAAAEPAAEPPYRATVVAPAAGAIPEDEHRFVLDEARFLEEIEPPPLFLQTRERL